MGPKLRSHGRSNAAKSSGRNRERGNQRKFENSRLADMKEDTGQISSPETSGEDLESSPPDSESELELEPGGQDKSYVSLLKSFAGHAEQPAAKRQKIYRRTQSFKTSGSGEPLVLNISGNNDSAGKDSVTIYKSLKNHTGPNEAYGTVHDDESEFENSDSNEPLDGTTDPFETHISRPNESYVQGRLNAIGNDEWSTTKSTISGSRFLFSEPQGNIAGSNGMSGSLPAAIHSTNDLKLKHRLSQAAIEAKQTKLDSSQQKIAPFLFNYLDLLFCERTPQNGDSLRRIACLHAINHVFKTRDRILKNNEKIGRDAKDEEAGEEANEYPDQGFTRPKVLILLPTRQSCVRMVDAICSICPKSRQENRKRFDESYVDGGTKISDDRPADFRDLFDGNNDDMFRLGLKFTRTTIKYFSQFYNSDIIIASPLGLRMAIGSDDAMASSTKSKANTKIDYDFLSSIEIVLVDQADSLLMQNWEHVEYIFDKLNVRPVGNRIVVNRLRNWYVEEQSKYYRQTIIFSAFHTPVLAELFRRHCNNWAGKVRVQTADIAGCVGRLGLRGIKQTFSRFTSPSVEKDPDSRFEYFIKVVVPAAVTKAGSDGGISGAATNRNSGILVFVPSYLDFVRIRNWFATATAVANVTFGAISEYASVPEASRALSHFLTGRHRLLLYTERAHHFHRQQISGVKTAIFYGLPENPSFYTEIAGGYLSRSQRNNKLELGQGGVRVLFSRYDALKLERVVGSQHVGRMIRGQSDTFVFEEERTG